VPAANIIGGVPGQGFKTAMKVLDRGRLNISAVSCGLAARILDESRRYARDRSSSANAIGEFQLIQAMLADSQAELLAAGRWCRRWRSASTASRPAPPTPMCRMRVSCAKLFATEMVGRVADRGVQVHGGAGYINEYPVERFYRDVRLLRLYEGTSQIQQLVIGRNKQDLALDLSRAEGIAVLFALLEQADVFIENFKMSTWRKWGIDNLDELTTRFPRLVHCRISGFGESGEFGGLPGYDAALQAMSGIMSVNGEPEGEATRVGMPLVDTATGMYAALGIALALLERQRSGKGQRLEATLYDTAHRLAPSTRFQCRARRSRRAHRQRPSQHRSL
jgi:hypothetical protein